MRAEMVTTAAGRRLLDVATELFYAQGIRAVGVAAIAEGAGVTKKTLYDCFGSKDSLVVAYLTRRHDEWQKILDARLASGPPTPLAVFDSYADHLGRGGAINGCAFINAAADLDLSHPAMEVIREHKAEVKRRLRQLLSPAGGTARKRDALATQLFYLLEGAVVHAGLAGDLAPLSRSRQLAKAMIARETGSVGSKTR